jgi:hypothetical protein
VIVNVGKKQLLFNAAIIKVPPTGERCIRTKKFPVDSYQFPAFIKAPKEVRCNL